MTIPIKFKTKPARAISIIRNRLDPNTMALGGVATGSINAIEALNVAGNISINGLTWYLDKDIFMRKNYDFYGINIFCLIIDFQKLPGC